MIKFDNICFNSRGEKYFCCSASSVYASSFHASNELIQLNWSDVSRVFLGRLVHTLNPWRHHYGWDANRYISKTVPPNALKMHSLTFFLVDYFEKIHIFINKICMAINLRELQSDLSWKDVATSAEGIIGSSVNYLYYLMTWSRFLQKSRRKRTFSWSITF